MVEPGRHAPGVTVTLTQDHALVIFEWLSRVQDNDRSFPEVLDAAESIALWALEGQLEKQVVGLFSRTYQADLRAAWQRLARPQA